MTKFTFQAPWWYNGRIHTALFCEQKVWDFRMRPPLGLSSESDSQSGSLSNLIQGKDLPTHITWNKLSSSGH